MSAPAMISAPAPARPRALRRHGLAACLPAVMAADAAIVAGSFLFFYAARFTWGWLSPAPAPDFGPYLQASALLAAVWTAGMAWVGVYDPKRPASRFDDAVLTATGLALGGVLGAALAALYRSFSYSRLVYAYAFVGALVTLWAWHLLLRGLQAAALRRGFGVRHTLVLGANPLGERVAERLTALPGHKVVGLAPMPGEGGRPADVTALIAELDVDEVVVAWPAASAAELVHVVRLVMAERGVTVQVAPDALADLPIQLEVASLDGLPMLALREVALRKRRHRAVKRAMDVTLAGLGLLAAAPLLLGIAAAVKLGSPGPVLYAQERLGRDGHRFTIYKFRSMPVGAEPDGPVWTRRDDDRATPLGAFLRKYSLDELPQLWNVLTGDMSLVGPRPERPYFVEQFTESVPRYQDRHLVRSGLTGWAQVNGMRGDVDIDARTRYDIQYVESWSVLLDLRILLMTLATIFRRPGY